MSRALFVRGSTDGTTVRPMLPLGLSMLWEAVEPNEALRTRFGFDDSAAVLEWISATLSRVWAIGVLTVPRMVISDHNAIVWVQSGQGPLVLKWSRAQDRFERLEAAARLLTWLDGQGLPVAAPIAPPHDPARVRVDGPLGPLSVVVLPELEGGWLDVGDETAVHAAGASLARLHAAMRDYADDRWQPGAAATSLTDRLERWLTDGDRGLAPAASARLRGLVDELPPLDGRRQLVHHDFRAANILTHASAVVGVLDFDEISWDHPLVDLAQASVYLGTRFTDWRPTPVAVRQQLLEGYATFRPLGSADGRWLEALVLWMAIAAIPGGLDPQGWASAL